MNPAFRLVAVLLIMLFPEHLLAAESPLVIAHRGASGYLPEHTLEAKVLAFAQGADFLEQDVVMTRDDQLVVFHDLTLERTTNVEIMYPERARSDGSWYVVDFTLAELRGLRVGEGERDIEGEITAIYPDRFPPGTSHFTIHTLQEELEVIHGLKASTGLEAGIYPELKSPWFHHQHGKDISTAVLQVLKEYGYTSTEDAVYLQSFDYNELVRVKNELLPAVGMDLKLVQLIADNSWGETRERNDNGIWTDYDYNWMHSQVGLGQLSNTVQGVGPSWDMLLVASPPGEIPAPNDFVSMAHDAGLEVHPFTFRRDQLPQWADDFGQLLNHFFNTLAVDGIFTDFPDLAKAFLESPQLP